MEKKFKNPQDIIESNFDILSIKKEMEIENIFLTDQNIKELNDLRNGTITPDELVSKALLGAENKFN